MSGSGASGSIGHEVVGTVSGEIADTMEPAMADTLTAPTVVPNTITSDPEEELDDGPLAHIVLCGPGENAVAKVLEARINGTPLEALCGHVWVPSRDPRQVPNCQKCQEIYGMFRSFRGDLNETPNI